MNRAPSTPLRLLLASGLALSTLAVAPALSAHPSDAKTKSDKAGWDVKQNPKTAVAHDASGQAHRTDCAASVNGPVAVASDPEEGGQIARTNSHRPNVSGISVTKRTDSASTKLMEHAARGSGCD